MTTSVVFALAFLTGCSGGKTMPDNSSETSVPLQIAVGLQRTMCYGSCPSFNFQVLNDGRATLKAGRFTEEVLGRDIEQGNYNCTISLEEIDAVTTYAESNGYLKLKERYDDKRVMDIPSTISIINGKTVFNRYNGPELDELYTMIEKLMINGDWLPQLPKPESQK